MFLSRHNFLSSFLKRLEPWGIWSTSAWWKLVLNVETTSSATAVLVAAQFQFQWRIPIPNKSLIKFDKRCLLNEESKLQSQVLNFVSHLNEAVRLTENRFFSAPIYFPSRVSNLLGNDRFKNWHFRAFKKISTLPVSTFRLGKKSDHFFPQERKSGLKFLKITFQNCCLPGKVRIL